MSTLFDGATPGSGPPRFAIFNAHWPLHSSVVYLANALSANKHRVDVFLYKTDETFAGSLFNVNEFLRVHRISAGKLQAPHVQRSNESRRKHAVYIKNLLSPVLRIRIRKVIQYLRYLFQPAYGLFSSESLSVVRTVLPEPETVTAIVVEKGGLAYANLAVGSQFLRQCYYSLELYTSAHPLMSDLGNFRCLGKLEHRFQQNVSLTIVQDRARAEILLNDLKMLARDLVTFLPICAYGLLSSVRAKWLNQELHLSESVRILLNFGVIRAERRCFELVAMAQRLASDWCLVFHGPCSSETRRRINRLDSDKRTRVSSNIIPAEDLSKVISSAQVGLVIYGDAVENDRLTGKSSEKLALYLKHGVPVIAMQYPSYEHLEVEGAAYLIREIDELPKALAYVVDNYEAFRQSAFRCYEKHYRFENIFPSLYADLTLNCQRRQSTDGHLIK